jgi:hypothetical protein
VTCRWSFIKRENRLEGSGELAAAASATDIARGLSAGSIRELVRGSIAAHWLARRQQRTPFRRDARYTSPAMFARRKFLRCKAVVFVALSLLFSQLALAAYVCPAEANSAGGMAQMMATGMPCEGADAVQPNLCHEHAVDLARLFELAQAASPSLPAVIQVLLIPAAPDVNDAVAMPPASTPEAQPPPDPIFLSTLRLRV